MLMEKSNNPLDEKFLSTIEQYLGSVLPSSYREFILKHNGGEPKEKFFFYKNDPSDGSLIDFFFGFVPDKHQNILLYLRNYSERIPPNMLPIASDPGGNLVCLSLKGPDRGKVYFWDHEMEADTDQGEVPDYSNLTLIADSFDDFIKNLRDEESLDLE